MSKRSNKILVWALPAAALTAVFVMNAKNQQSEISPDVPDTIQPVPNRGDLSFAERGAVKAAKVTGNCDILPEDLELACIQEELLDRWPYASYPDKDQPVLDSGPD